MNEKYLAQTNESETIGSNDYHEPASPFTLNRVIIDSSILLPPSNTFPSTAIF